MASSIHANQWRHYTRELLRVTRPGGWTQMVELYFNVQSDNGSLTPGWWSSQKELDEHRVNEINRSCNMPVEYLVPREFTGLEGPESSSPLISFDERGRIRRCRISNDSTPHLWMVDRCAFFSNLCTVTNNWTHQIHERTELALRIEKMSRGF